MSRKQSNKFVLTTQRIRFTDIGNRIDDFRGEKMPKKANPKDPFMELTWADMEAWAGYRIVFRGKGYQRQGVVSNLAQTADGGAIFKASVRYTFENGV